MLLNTNPLPKDVFYCFSPAFGPGPGPRPIHIVMQNLPISILTSLIAASYEQTQEHCDALNAQLGLDRNTWTTLAKRCITTNPHRANTLVH